MNSLANSAADILCILLGILYAFINGNVKGTEFICRFSIIRRLHKKRTFRVCKTFYVYSFWFYNRILSFYEILISYVLFFFLQILHEKMCFFQGAYIVLVKMKW